MNEKLPSEYGTEILRAEVGSTLHGISVGNDDLDLMGVCLEPPRFVVGLDTFEQYIYRTAAVRESRHDAPSKPGDVDLTVYSLRKWARLALKGNPTVLLLLYVQPDKLQLRTPTGEALQDLHGAFQSREAGKAFLGYLSAQKSRMLRERGTSSVPDRDDKDGKYLAHMLRLGFQGREYMSTGWITLPMHEVERDVCLAARRGDMDVHESLTWVGQLEREIKDLLTDSPLPERPDRETVQSFLLKAYADEWWKL